MEKRSKGLLYGIVAYIMWGLLSLYWKAVHGVGAMDILCYRIVWSLVFMGICLLVTGRWRQFLVETKEILSDKKKSIAILAGAFLISANWFIYIWSVGSNHLAETSLGYYINPLVNILLATVFLKERLGRSGKIACLLACIGVLWLVVQTGVFPWRALLLAMTFGLYGLIKKGIVISSSTSLTLETLIVAPIALIYLFGFSSQGFMHYSAPINLLLVGAGIVTAIPLLLFAEAAKNLPYIVLGFIQYISPTLTLIFAIFLFHEPYSMQQFAAFLFIWLGIAVFTFGNIQQYRKEKSFAKKNI